MNVPAITDVRGVLVGHAADADALTGVTVVLTPDGATAGVDVRGGAPGTRETDLLDPVNLVQQVNAVVLTGGSAFGLAAATGVVSWLHERGYGFDVGLTRVPIVPAAVIFDLGIGRPDVWPDAAMGYAACAAAEASVPEGSVGAGIGATVGKVGGMTTAMRGGVGTWSETLANGVTVGALAVVNAFGDVVDPQGRLIAGALGPGQQLIGTGALLRNGLSRQSFADSTGQNTTIAVVATDARLDKAAARRLAIMAQDGLSRSIRPAHSPFDGDTVFALATGVLDAPPLVTLGAVAADVLAIAIARAVQMATTAAGVPAARDLATP
ncbi:P1 family peptidase [Chloroflexus sp.]|uniref:P1 family peptidase n=1 Tax=Chloroflexus sp. TaxID=1904827 RepID=UPI002625FEC7|nr:P1 family peptidase [uncultured Chloroflexus sp.]